MSYILDALRKAEQERLLGQPPALTAAPPPADPARNRFWHGLTVLGLGLNAVLLAFFLGRSPLVSEPPSATPPMAVPSAPLAPRSLPVASEASERDGPPVAPRQEPVRPTATPGSVPPAPVPEPAPPLETLSADRRRDMPALNLDIHIHSADPDKRFVVINGRRYREGERLSEGPVLESVTRDGAILRQDGRRFRLSVRR